MGHGLGISYIGCNMVDNFRKTIYKIALIIFYILIIGLVIYAAYLPFTYFWYVGHKAIDLVPQFDRNLASPTEFKINATLKGLLYLVGPIILYGCSMLLPKLKKIHLRRTAIFFTFYSLILIITFIVLLWLDFNYTIAYHHPGAHILVRIGFIFNFPAW